MATMDTYPASHTVQPAAADVADGEVPAEQPASTGGKRCFVNNLAWRTSWQDLKDHFRGNGTVVFANVIRDQAGILP
jgi:RNA recognition motif-containing protein